MSTAAASSAFAQRRRQRVDALLAPLVRVGIPRLAAPAQAENLALAVDFVRSNLMASAHQRYDVNEHRIRAQLAGIAHSLTVHAHPAHAAALTYLAARARAKMADRLHTNVDLEGDAADRVLQLLLALASRPAAAADADVARDPDGLRKRLERICGEDLGLVHETSTVTDVSETTEAQQGENGDDESWADSQPWTEDEEEEEKAEQTEERLMDSAAETDRNADAAQHTTTPEKTELARPTAADAAARAEQVLRARVAGEYASRSLDPALGKCRGVLLE